MHLGCEKIHQNSANCVVITKKLGRVTGLAHKVHFLFRRDLCGQLRDTSVKLFHVNLDLCFCPATLPLGTRASQEN